jgi:urea transport system ATP-binding protein
MTATLHVQGLNVYYGESHILRNVDLSVQPGQMVCLIGRNGVGKTTLLKTVIGLLRQRSGQVELEGRRPIAAPVAASATCPRAGRSSPS